MSSIPEELHFDILSRMPVKSLLACKSVCKTWYSLISSLDFIKMQLNFTSKRNNPSLLLKGHDSCKSRNLFYSICHDSLELLLPSDRLLDDYAVEIDYLSCAVQLLGCCDGLDCLWLNERQCFGLWNPATREYKELPPASNHRHHDLVRMVAFGYDCKSDDYKLLAGFESPFIFKVYSLRLNSWEAVKCPLYKFDVSKPFGVLVNGDFHWLAWRKDSWDDAVVVSLDMSNQIFKEMKLPKKLLKNYSVFGGLGVLDGCLCLFSVDVYDLVQVWVMQEYGVRKSWTKRYTVYDEEITVDSSSRLMWSFKGGEILFGGVCAGLHLYHPKHGTVTGLNISSLTDLSQQVCYIESLVPLKSRSTSLL